MELALALHRTKRELLDALEYPGGANELVEWQALFSLKHDEQPKN